MVVAVMGLVVVVLLLLVRMRSASTRPTSRRWVALAGLVSMRVRVGTRPGAVLSFFASHAARLAACGAGICGLPGICIWWGVAAADLCMRWGCRGRGQPQGGVGGTATDLSRACGMVGVCCRSVSSPATQWGVEIVLFVETLQILEPKSLCRSMRSPATQTSSRKWRSECAGRLMDGLQGGGLCTLSTLSTLSWSPSSATSSLAKSRYVCGCVGVGVGGRVGPALCCVTGAGAGAGAGTEGVCEWGGFVCFLCF